MIDPGVADVPEEDEYDEDQDQEKKEKPSYITRAVAARERAGPNRELPRLARGVDESAGDVIEIDDDGNWVQADVPVIEPTIKIKLEIEDTPVEPEQEQEQVKKENESIQVCLRGRHLGGINITS